MANENIGHDQQIAGLGFLAGMVIGVIAAALLTPKSGREARDMVKKTYDKAKGKTQETYDKAKDRIKS